MDGQTQQPMRGSNCVAVSCYIKGPSGAVMSGSASSPITLFLFTSHFFHKVLEGNVLLPVWSVRIKHARLPLCLACVYPVLVYLPLTEGFDIIKRASVIALIQCTESRLQYSVLELLKWLSNDVYIQLNCVVQ